MEPITLPVNFNWVKSRGDCSIAAIFKALELGVCADVDAVKVLLRPEGGSTFSIVASYKRFSVIREEAASSKSPLGSSRDVNFVLEGHEIVISEGNRERFKATITLNNEGQCKLVVGQNELEQWQVRRMALEELFFGQHG